MGWDKERIEKAYDLFSSGWGGGDIANEGEAALDEIERLQGLLERAQMHLQCAEWCWRRSAARCPSCYRTDMDGHSPGCGFAALLRDLGDDR